MHIVRLQAGYRNDRPDAVAALARIRRGAGRPANTLPDLWGLTGTERLFGYGLDEKEITRAENAVHIAVTLWALHQQSRRDANMHVSDGPQFGSAVRKLMPGAEIDEAIRKRFVRAGTATSLDVLSQRLRDLVLLLRQAALPLDYGLLADQLYQWQEPGGQTLVHRAWGRSFHAFRPAEAGSAANPTSTDMKDFS